MDYWWIRMKIADICLYFGQYTEIINNLWQCIWLEDWRTSQFNVKVLAEICWPVILTRTALFCLCSVCDRRYLNIIWYTLTFRYSPSLKLHPCITLWCRNAPFAKLEISRCTFVPYTGNRALTFHPECLSRHLSHVLRCSAQKPEEW